MSNEKMRAEFEAVYFTNNATSNRWDDQDGGYDDSHTQTAWFYWQASRAALCVELPVGGMTTDGEKWIPVSACRDAIESTGVRVK
jgi:hypothetical protein